MREVKEPKWIGVSTIWICRGCEVFWIDPDTHINIPEPEDFLTKDGDATLLKDRVEGIKDYLLTNEKAKAEEDDPRVDGPSFPLNLVGFLGLPVEYSSKLGIGWPIVTYFLIACMFTLFILVTNKDHLFIAQYGFIPAHPFKNAGINFFLSPFLHAGWLHILGNMYFFAMFSDDVEERLGKLGFIIFIFFSIICTQFGTIIIAGSPEKPYIGFSGVITGILVFYALEFPKNKITYLLPGFHYLAVGRGEAIPRALMTMRWIALPAILVIPWYVVLDIWRWYFYEQHGFSGIAHSAHISGALSGLIAWVISLGLVTPVKPIAPASSNSEYKNKKSIPQLEPPTN